MLHSPAKKNNSNLLSREREAVGAGAGGDDVDMDANTEVNAAKCTQSKKLFAIRGINACALRREMFHVDNAAKVNLAHNV